MSHFFFFFLQSAPVKPLASAVAHVLTLVSGLAGGVSGGTVALERHPALGSLLRALCLRVPDPAVRRAACAVLYRASCWQALGRDTIATAVGGGGGGVAAAAAALAVSDGEVSTAPSSSTQSSSTPDNSSRQPAAAAVMGPVAATAAAAASTTPPATTGRKNGAASGSLARVLFDCLRSDMGRVQTIPSARNNSSGAGPVAGVALSPVRPARGTTAAAGDVDGSGTSTSGDDSSRLPPVVVPRLHLVEVTAFVSGLVHVMLQQSAAATGPNGTGTSAIGRGLAPALPLSDGRAAASRTDGAVSASLPAVPARSGVSVFSKGGGKEGIGGASVDPSSSAVGGGAASAGADEGAEAAADWLLREAARRLVAHEFTETFK